MVTISDLGPHAVLERAASYIRSERLRGREDLELDVAHANGMASAFEHAGFIDASERIVWERRFDEAAAIDRGEFDRTPPQAIPPAPLVRLICGTVQTQPFLDGGIVIPVVEVLATNTVVHWRLTPPPSVNAVLGPEADRIESDLSGVSEATADELQDVAMPAYSARLHYLVRLNVADDVGTQYAPVAWRYSLAGGSAWPVVDDLWGVAVFTPGVPAAGGVLTVAVGGVDFRFSI